MISSPSIFTAARSIGKTKIVADGLKGQVFEVSLTDLKNDEDHAPLKINLRDEDVHVKNILTNF